MNHDATSRDRAPHDVSPRPALAGGQRGFTLIEIMIAVAIVGVVTAIALPSFFRHVETARRTDATAFLSEVNGEQVRFFSENNAYATSMDELGYGAAATHPTPEGHYVVSIAPLGARGGYTLTATAATGGPQANDTDCATISITSTGVRTPSRAAGDAVDCW